MPRRRVRPPNDDYLDSFPLNQRGQEAQPHRHAARQSRHVTSPRSRPTCSPRRTRVGRRSPRPAAQRATARPSGTTSIPTSPVSSGCAPTATTPRSPWSRSTARRPCRASASGNASTSPPAPPRSSWHSVAKGRPYTIQIGAVGGVGGRLEFLFDFLADTDGDNVLDDVDKCDRLKGSASEAGCPVRLNAGVTLRAAPTATGIRVASLRVKAPRKSRVSVSCSGCGSQVKTAKTVSFGRLRGKSLRAGHQARDPRHAPQLDRHLRELQASRAATSRRPSAASIRARGSRDASAASRSERLARGRGAAGGGARIRCRVRRREGRGGRRRRRRGARLPSSRRRTARRRSRAWPRPRRFPRLRAAPQPSGGGGMAAPAAASRRPPRLRAPRRPHRPPAAAVEAAAAAAAAAAGRSSRASRPSAVDSDPLCSPKARPSVDTGSMAPSARAAWALSTAPPSSRSIAASR